MSTSTLARKSVPVGSPTGGARPLPLSVDLAAVCGVDLSPADILLSQEQTKEILHLKNVGTLAVWRSEKRYGLNYVRVGSKIFYTLAAVQEFIKRRTVVVAERV